MMLGYLGYQFYRGVDDAYAEEGAARMVVAYLDENQQQWPNRWQDLEPYFEKFSQVSGQSFEQLQDRVWIDFNVDSKSLSDRSQDADSIPFNVIGTKNIFAAHFEDGPNRTIFDYFKLNPVPSKKEILKAQQVAENLAVAKTYQVSGFQLQPKQSESDEKEPQ